MPLVNGYNMSPDGVQGDIIRLTEELDEHAPWHYFEFGVECMCGMPCTVEDRCCIAQAIYDRLSLLEGIN